MHNLNNSQETHEKVKHKTYLKYYYLNFKCTENVVKLANCCRFCLKQSNHNFFLLYKTMLQLMTQTHLQQSGSTVYATQQNVESAERAS